MFFFVCVKLSGIPARLDFSKYLHVRKLGHAKSVQEFQCLLFKFVGSELAAQEIGATF